MRSQLVVCIKFRCGATSHWWLVVCREKTRPPSIRYNSGTILHKNVCQYFPYLLDYDTIDARPNSKKSVIFLNTLSSLA